MLTLDNLQSEFQAYLTQGKEKNILNQIAPDTHFSASNRLKVYFNAYRLRLLDILKLDFSKTHTLMGDEEFESAFSLYLQQHPSQHFSVRYFGQRFPHFLANTAPYQDFPVLFEMAQFEWLVSFTLDAKDGPKITVEDFSKVPPAHWAEMIFTFHPSVISHYFHWDTPQLWQDIENELPPRDPCQLEKTRWIFSRKELVCLFQSCTPAEDKMFEAIENGKNFGEICEDLLDLHNEDEVPTLAAQSLYKWVNQGLISICEVKQA